MATTLIKRDTEQGVALFRWDLASGEIGVPARVVGWPDKTVTIYGTFTGGGNVQIEYTLDPDAPAATAAGTPPFLIARDLVGNPISGIVTPYGEVMQQHAYFVRPVATTITAVTIWLICSAARMRI